MPVIRHCVVCKSASSRASNHDFPYQRPGFTVKVKNLSKKASVEDLANVLGYYIESVSDIRIQECPESRVNYAAVDCLDS